MILGTKDEGLPHANDREPAVFLAYQSDSLKWLHYFCQLISCQGLTGVFRSTSTPESLVATAPPPCIGFLWFLGVLLNVLPPWTAWPQTLRLILCLLRRIPRWIATSTVIATTRLLRLGFANNGPDMWLRNVGHKVISLPLRCFYPLSRLLNGRFLPLTSRR